MHGEASNTIRPAPSPVRIRRAVESDLPALTAIYNEVIASSTAVYSDNPVDLADRRAWWAARVGQGYPVLVADAGEGVLGFSTFGDFRAWPGYRFSVEHSVHVAAGHRGGGVGRALVEALFPIAASLGKHVMLAGVDGENAASIRFHERLGFEQAGRLRQVGFKFDRYLDLVFLQRFL
jgi:phosphinothricin acetyltransferase